MRPWLAVVFFLSGAAALIYQIAWQRALFVIYGLDAVSSTIVVTAFMLGLGLGSLAGGALSKTCPHAAVGLFAASEVSIGVFGYFSLDLFDVVARWTVGICHVATGVVAFLLVVIPTTPMGAGFAPVVRDPVRWKSTMDAWTIQGRPVIDPVRDAGLLDGILAEADWRGGSTWEDRAVILGRSIDEAIITDDNMATEWWAFDTYP